MDLIAFSMKRLRFWSVNMSIPAQRGIRPPTESTASLHHCREIMFKFKVPSFIKDIKHPTLLTLKHQAFKLAPWAAPLGLIGKSLACMHANS